MAKSTRKPRRRSKDLIQPAAGVAWYDRDQWARVRELAADPDLLERSYEDWLAMAERSVRDLEAAGVMIVRVPVVAEVLEAWCRANELPVNSAARARFAAFELRRGHS